jgi:hypothetical protein
MMIAKESLPARRAATGKKAWIEDGQDVGGMFFLMSPTDFPP